MFNIKYSRDLNKNKHNNSCQFLSTCFKLKNEIFI